MALSNDFAPCSFSHVGISVPDLDAAVKFYAGVMVLYVLMEPSEVTEDDSAIGVMCTDVFGAGLDRLRIAHLFIADGIGFELFEFKGNKEPDDNVAYRRQGTFHFAVQDPNLEDLLEKILAAGGKQRMPVREYFPDEKPFRMVYVEDPFGVVFELYRHSHEPIYSAGAYS